MGHDVIIFTHQDAIFVFDLTQPCIALHRPILPKSYKSVSLSGLSQILSWRWTVNLTTSSLQTNADFEQHEPGLNFLGVSWQSQIQVLMEDHFHTLKRIDEGKSLEWNLFTKKHVWRKILFIVMDKRQTAPNCSKS